MFRFQMIYSQNPLTIAEVLSESDAKTFRDNPEWYEVFEEEASIEKASRKRKSKGESNGDQEKED